MTSSIIMNEGTPAERRRGLAREYRVKSVIWLEHA